MRAKLYQKRPPRAKVAGRAAYREPSPPPNLSRRQRSTAPWSPDSSTAGTGQPRNSAGRVYWGYSRAPPRPARTSRRPRWRGSTPPRRSCARRRRAAPGPRSRPRTARRARWRRVGHQLRDALVDAFVAAAQHAQVGAGELGGQRVVELTPAGRQPTTRRPSATRTGSTANTASRAAQTTSMRSTMPAPPP